jgi:hypothetical protein
MGVDGQPPQLHLPRRPIAWRAACVDHGGLDTMRMNPFGSPLGWQVVFDAMVVSYAFSLLTGSALVVLKSLFRQAGWI